MKTKVFILAFSLLLLSCEKDEPFVTDDPQVTVENTDIPLITKELHGGETYKEYTYNDRNLLQEEKTRFHYTAYTYNLSNQLVTAEYYMDMSMVSSNSRVLEEAMNREEWVNPENTELSLTKSFGYDNRDHTITIGFIRPGVDHSEYSEFSYENDRISRQTMYWNDELSHYIDYVYDERGNLVKETKYRVLPNVNDEMLTTTEYEYDGMHNPFQAFQRLLTPGIHTNANNIVRQTYTLHFEVDPFIEQVQVREYSYEYNDLGYPILKRYLPDTNEVSYVYR